MEWEKWFHSHPSFHCYILAFNQNVGKLFIGDDDNKNNNGCVGEKYTGNIYSACRSIDLVWVVVA